MNKQIGKIGSLVNVFTVASFAICMLISFDFGSYFVSMFIALSFIIMIASFEEECSNENKVAGKVALTLAGVYATLILIVYFTQCTTVMNEQLTNDAMQILNYKYRGLLFNIDLLGYGIMALSTFFIGLTVNVKNKKDKILKLLLLIHGIFFISCLLMPITGIFTNIEGTTSIGGVIALEIWCLYFLPIGILSYLHFKEN
jgi:hypothetical protein